VRFLAATGDTVTLEVGNVGYQRRRAQGTALVPNDASLEYDAAMTGKEPVAAKREVA
jgi:hypothetical protein